MEHVLCHSIMKHLESHHILNGFQYGIQPGHSCQAQLISIVEEIQYALDQHYQVDLGLIMLDLYKAFDTVAHNHPLSFMVYKGQGSQMANYLVDTENTACCPRWFFIKLC